jgi:hypothetical protein
MLGAGVAPGSALGTRRTQQGNRERSGNLFPGRAVLVWDPDATAGSGGNQPVVDAMVDTAVMRLTGTSSLADAYETLMPDITPTTMIAMKVNCLFTTNSRWEVAAAVCRGLADCCGGTYDVSNIHLFDNNNVHYWGFTEERLTFRGNTVTIHDTESPTSGYWIPGIGQLSQWIYDAQYLINMPVLKDHGCEHDFTLAFKNHFGSTSSHHPVGQILDLNNDPHIKDKTILCVLSALFGVYAGGPGGPPQVWDHVPYPPTPSAIVMSTDPTTTDYLGRDIINTERIGRPGMGPKDGEYIEQSSAPPYEIGVSDPASMTIIEIDGVVGVEGPPPVSVRNVFLNSQPNPFRRMTEVRLGLSRGGMGDVSIYDANGRLVRRLFTGHANAGVQTLKWMGKDDAGRRLPRGIYYLKAEFGGDEITRKITLLR